MVPPSPFSSREDRPPLDFVLADYPFPVAVAYSRFHLELDRQEPVAAAWQFLDAFQGALKFCACVAVADLLRAEPTGPDAAKLVERLFKPLSLGDWQSLLEDALRPLKDSSRRSGRRVGELYNVFFRSTNGQRTEVARKLFGGQQTLVQWRNDVFGHGVFRHGRAFYADEVNRFRPVLDELLTALRPVLSAWALVGRTPGGDRVDWTGAGEASPAAPHAHQPWGDPLPLLLSRRSGETADGLDLGPLLTVQQCLLCRQPAAFFFDGIEERKKNVYRTFFIEYFAGHDQRRDDWPEARKLADRLPAGFEWERASYDWKAAAEEVSRLFRSFEDEYRRPDYLLDAFWNRVDGGARGYVNLVGPAGTGKSYLVQGLQQDARNRGEAVLAYHILSGQLADYRAFVSELADRAREQLRCRTQEIQTRVARLSDLAEQTAEFLGELMRANRLRRLIVAIDGLDELREPEQPGGPLITDFLPPPDRLPEGCFILLTSRSELRPAVRDRLNLLRTQNAAAFHELSLHPDGEANRELIRAYLREKLPVGPPEFGGWRAVARRIAQFFQRSRQPTSKIGTTQWPEKSPRSEIVEEVLRRSGGVFLYAFHLSRALASGAFADTGSLPEGEQFYPAYLARLREQVGDQEYERVYLRTLLLLAAARQPVLPEQLARWGMRRDRVPLVLQDLADFLRLVKGRRWHESFNDDGENRYELAHEAFVRFVRQDARLAEQLRHAHRMIADAALGRHRGQWEALDPYDGADLYDLRYVGTHLSAGGPRLVALAGDFVTACFRFGNQAKERQRSTIARDLFEQAVTILRGLVQSGRTELEDDLAGALSNLGAALQVLDQPAEAVAAYREAVAIRRRLVQSGRTELDNDLASALNNLGAALQVLRQPAEAVAASREAVAIRRLLVQSGRPELENDLAGTLSNLGDALRVLGQPAEAVAACREAVAVYHRLVQSGRTELDNDLASALNNLGAALQVLRQPAEAVAASREAVAIRRRLVQSGRTELDNDLAGALSNLGATLQVLRQLAEAVAVYHEAVAVYRRLVQSGRTELENDLAGTLSNLGDALRVLGQPAEAVAACREAVAVYHRLVQSGRTELDNDLASALNNLGAALQVLGQPAEAVAVYHEAVGVYRRLVQSGRTELDNDLARALSNLGATLQVLRQLAEAVAVYHEAVAVYRRLVQSGRTELENDLAGTLSNLGDALRVLGQPAEAVAACREAVAVYHRLVQSGRTELENDLAIALLNLGITHSDGGDASTAVASCDEAMEIWLRYVERGQVHLLPYLLQACGIRFSFHCRQQDWDAAAGAVRAVLRLTLPLFQDGQPPAPVIQTLKAFLGRIRRLKDDERQALFTALGEDATTALGEDAAVVRQLLGE